MERVSMRVVALLGATVVMLPFLAPTASPAQTSDRAVEVVTGVFASHTENWSLAEAQYRNALELVTPAENLAAGVAQARLLITSERRRGHADALGRLAEIAAEVDSPLSFLQIGVWPALELRSLAPLQDKTLPEGQIRGAEQPVPAPGPGPISPGSGPGSAPEVLPPAEKATEVPIGRLEGYEEEKRKALEIPFGGRPPGTIQEDSTVRCGGAESGSCSHK